MLRVYPASELSRANTWRRLCDTNDHIILNARWLKHIKIGTPDTPDRARSFWLQDERDIKSADVLLVWAEDGEHLKGALVEVGMAIAYGVPVITVGKHCDYSTWQYHPGVTRAYSITHAMALLRDMHDRTERAI